MIYVVVVVLQNITWGPAPAHVPPRSRDSRPALPRYRSTYTYDANGNITAAERWDRDGNKYDQFSYKYEQRGGRLERNRLYQLNDLADAGNLLVNEANGAKDIGYTGNVPFVAEATTINEDYNYRYDQLGNLAKDVREGIDTIHWTVAGKVKQVEKTDGTVLTFAYGADGQRLWKEVTPPVLDDTGYREYYIRDAQGNIMATYRSQLITVPSPEPQGYAASLRVTERPVYGSSRLGTYARWEELYDHPVVSTPAPDPVQPVDLNYELTDHLGNVTAVVTGRLLNGNGGGTPKQAELVSAQGYEAFGSLLPGRNYNSGSSRYLFQGQEHDDEINGSVGTSYAFEYRMHDPRIGRFLSIDPLAAKYPQWSPYAFSGNQVIATRELEGLEPDKDLNSMKVPTGIKALAQMGTATGVTNGKAGSTSSLAMAASAPSPQQGFVGVPALPLGAPAPAPTTTPTPNTLPRPGPPGVAPSLGLRSLGVIGAMLAPTPTGDLISPHEQQQLFQQWKQDEDDKQLVTLFRGVANNVPTNSFQYEAALFGMAVPRGLFDKNPHMSMEDHTFGFTESSLFTSWSLQESVAVDFASRGQLGGVVLSKQFPKSVLRQQSALGVSSFKEEHEILIMGVQRGAQVRLLP